MEYRPIIKSKQQQQQQQQKNRNDSIDYRRKTHKHT